MTDISEIEQFILNGENHTLRDICRHFAVVDDKHERQIDKIIQRLRKRGSIELTRQGRLQFWTATPSKAVA